MSQSAKELTVLSIGVGIVIGIIMTAANVYLGLYAGMTVSASIPAAVISMAVFRGILKKKALLQSNIVQTMASAGESLAAGIIFTLPALILVGAWQDFKFWPTTLIAVSGGLLGIIFMIPLRKVLIIEDKNLTYPEGVACASVLRAGDSADSESGGGEVMAILKGFLIGGVVKFLSAGLKLVHGSVEWATKISPKAVFFLGTDISPALVAVGYIVRLEVAILVFIGGAIGWFVGVPLLDAGSGAALDSAWDLWSGQIRYLGVGAMVVGGLWSIVKVRKGIVRGLLDLKKTYSDKNPKEIDRRHLDLPLPVMIGVFLTTAVVMLLLYHNFIGNFAIASMTTIIMLGASFMFVAVSSYIVGLVGSSNNPVSGMTISALLGTAILFLILGFRGDSAILATLGVAAVVCCAACTAGDCSQDLKTGSLVGASPRAQQIAQIIGVIVPAVVIAPVLTLLHSAYGIGVGLKAPQATLFASITKALFSSGNLPYTMLAIGAVVAVIIIIVDQILENKKSSWRLHLMPIAVGIYLPVTLAVPILLGGLVAHYLAPKSESEDKGILVSSGLIAGEAIMGVFIAILMYFNFKLELSLLSHNQGAVLSLAILALVTAYLAKNSK